MRILTVCSSFRVFGAETITLKLLEGFKRYGHEQVAVTSVWTDGEFNRRLSALGIADVQLALGAVTKRISPRYLWWTANTIARLPGAWLKWRQVLRTFRPDAILFTGSRQALLLYPWLGWCRSFLIEHAEAENNSRNDWIYQRLSKRVVGFVAVSDFMRSFYNRMGVPASQIRVIKNGPFDEKYFRDSKLMPMRESLSSRPVRLGIVGQISPRKGHTCLAQATRLLSERGLDFEVVVFGSGDPNYVTELKRLLVTLQLEQRWAWKGYVSDQHLIYRQMDICIMPSCAAESFGMVAAEASAHELPVVASRIGGLPEIVDSGVTGFLVEPDAPEELARVIETLIRNPARARAMGAAGRERVFANFTVEKMVEEFETMFATCRRNRA
jgi:glycosyltransferase involved in cell wall biosynthesis